ncbi:hypothetical protein RN001_002500 [Aquatica leii]|uniref:Uncharacterized protein n=1 Tax=Aquatica leii TaxID=1421715 RepID=A0AAN7SLV2_9COLE|nr:hypothetical protein RN001_002500 [Aquatica leii]
MQYLLIIPCIFVFTYAVSDQFVKEVKSKIVEIASDCISEVGASNEDVLELLSKKLPSTREGKCLVSCFQKKFGFQDENGKPDQERTLALLESLHDDDPVMYNNVLQIALTCSSEVYKMEIADHCDAAVAICVCAIREGQKFGLEDPFILTG